MQAWHGRQLEALQGGVSGINELQLLYLLGPSR